MKTITFTCDRCGKKFNKQYSYSNVSVSFHGMSENLLLSTTTQDIDLCPRCLCNLKKWWETHEKDGVV